MKNGKIRVGVIGVHNLSFDREMGQECTDFGCSHFDGVPLAVKQDALSNPVEVGLFGAIAIVACADEVTHLFEQL